MGVGVGVRDAPTRVIGAGMDVGAIERLGERMRRSGAQEASVSREVDEREAERQAEIERRIEQERNLDHGFGIE